MWFMCSYIEEFIGGTIACIKAKDVDEARVKFIKYLGEHEYNFRYYDYESSENFILISKADNVDFIN